MNGSERHSSNPRIALVTGAAQGLGRAIAERLGREGHRLLLADIDPELLSNTAEDLRLAGLNARALPFDVAKESDVLRAFSEIEQSFGQLNILVNNAGISGERAPVETISLKGWEQTLRTNLTSSFLMSRGAIPLMRPHGWGRIVNLTSLSARGQPGTMRSPYVASKAGIIGLTRVLAEELGPHGITANCVAPSRIRTALTVAASQGRTDYWERGAAGSVFGRLGEPAEVAHAVAWLCSDSADFINGAVLDVNGGTVMQ